MNFIALHYVKNQVTNMKRSIETEDQSLYNDYLRA